ncbi:MAG: 2-oxo acid dehydrogenase subunit E2, partial [Actinomycetota bacterium]|nr:2-oxo acid dehydrogenase subunit E2 [Actinomycetota bacterium]
MTSHDPRLGPNSWLVEEMFERWRANPSTVDDSWRALFEEGSTDPVAPLPAGDGFDPVAPLPAGGPVESEPAAMAAPTPSPSVAAAPTPPSTVAAAPVVEEGQPIRGVGARIVANMEASLVVPTATSYRQVPAKLLELNRRIINDHLVKMLRGKVSFTHLIAYAIVRALDEVPSMTSTFLEGDDGRPRVVHHDEVGLGIAVDMERADGTRSLLVPCIRGANLLPFQEFLDEYEALIDKVRNNRISPDDFAGVTLSITNVGTLGTVQSVPRLMPGQAAIVGLGAIGYPAEFEGADPRTMADLGLSKIVTVSNTYDHRIIQGAESGEFLRTVHQLLLGADGFYDRIFGSLGVPHQPVRWQQDDNPADHEAGYAHK